MVRVPIDPELFSVTDCGTAVVVVVVLVVPPLGSSVVVDVVLVVVIAVLRVVVLVAVDDASILSASFRSSSEICVVMHNSHQLYVLGTVSCVNLSPQQQLPDVRTRQTRTV